MSRKPLWSAAMRCANPVRLEGDLHALEQAGCHELHVDVMDGAFTPGFGLGLDAIAAVTASSKLPLDAHLMTERPERHLKQFAEAGCAGLTVHVEACMHAHRILTEIRELGMEAGIAINSATALTKLEYLLPHVDRVLVLTREIGSGPGPVPVAAFERVKIVRENLDYHEQGGKLQVEGGIGAADAARLIEIGADVVVVDSPEVFGREYLAEAMAQFIQNVESARKAI